MVEYLTHKRYLGSISFRVVDAAGWLICRTDPIHPTMTFGWDKGKLRFCASIRDSRTANKGEARLTSH